VGLFLRARCAVFGYIDSVSGPVSSSVSQEWLGNLTLAQERGERLIGVLKRNDWAAVGASDARGLVVRFIGQIDGSCWEARLFLPQ